MTGQPELLSGGEAQKELDAISSRQRTGNACGRHVVSRHCPMAWPSHRYTEITRYPAIDRRHTMERPRSLGPRDTALPIQTIALKRRLSDLNSLVTTLSARMWYDARHESPPAAFLR
jgi:hypothetical protein